MRLRALWNFSLSILTASHLVSGEGSASRETRCPNLLLLLLMGGDEPSGQAGHSRAGAHPAPLTWYWLTAFQEWPQSFCAFHELSFISKHSKVKLIFILSHLFSSDIWQRNLCLVAIGTAMVKLLIAVVPPWFLIFVNACVALKRRLEDCCVSEICHPTASEEWTHWQAVTCHCYLTKHHHFEAGIRLTTAAMSTRNEGNFRRGEAFRVWAKVRVSGQYEKKTNGLSVKSVGYWF